MSDSIGDVMQRLREKLGEPSEPREGVTYAPEHQPEPTEDEMARVTADMLRQDRLRCREVAGMPERVRNMLTTVTNTAAVESAREFISGSRTLLVLAGGTGCGKTVAGCVAIDEYLQRDGYRFRRVGRFVKAIDLVRAGTFDAEFWEGHERSPLLVIDDLGTEPLDEKGWALANLAALIDKRYDACRKTILTTNLDVARFKARYCNDGGRLADRIREAGAFIEFDGKSLRGQP